MLLLCRNKPSMTTLAPVLTGEDDRMPLSLRNDIPDFLGDFLGRQKLLLKHLNKERASPAAILRAGTCGIIAGSAMTTSYLTEVLRPKLMTMLLRHWAYNRVWSSSCVCCPSGPIQTLPCRDSPEDPAR